MNKIGFSIKNDNNKIIICNAIDDNKGNIIQEYDGELKKVVIQVGKLYNDKLSIGGYLETDTECKYFVRTIDDITFESKIH